MQVIATVIHRDSARGDDGRVYVIDWTTGQVIHEFSPPSAIIDEFPDAGGGGLRGSRGICFVDNLCFIASADTLYGYDSNWELQRTVSHPLFSDLHEIAWDGTGFWVTSTGIDAVLRVSIDSELLESTWFGELPMAIAADLDIPPRAVRRDTDHRMKHHPMREEHVAHPNAVQIVDGRPIVTLYYQGAVVALDPIEVIWVDRDFYGSHSGRIVGDQLFLAASFKQSLLSVDLTSNTPSIIGVLDGIEDPRGATRRRLQDAALWIDARSRLARAVAARAPGWLNPKPQRNRPGWTRGLSVLDDGTVLLGSSPASVYRIDPRSATIMERVQLSDHLPHSVFAVEVDPRGGRNWGIQDG